MDLGPWTALGRQHRIFGTRSRSGFGRSLHSLDEPCERTTPGLKGESYVRSPGLTVLRTFTHHQLTALERGVHWVAPTVICDNGSRIAFAMVQSDGSATGDGVVDTDGRNLRQIGSPGYLTGIDLSGDGSQVIWHHGGELFLVNADGSGTRPGQRPLGAHARGRPLHRRHQRQPVAALRPQQ